MRRVGLFEVHVHCIRLPHAFEHHHRYVELTWILQPILTSLSRSVRFSGGINPWTGAEGDSENFSGAMLCVLDYLERLCGIFPTPQGDLWFTSLIPSGLDFGETVAESTGYGRTVDGAQFELVSGPDGSAVFKDREPLYSIPQGIRLVTDRAGNLKEIIGMSVRTVAGEILYLGRGIPFSASGNERLAYTGTGFVSVENIGVILPCYEAQTA